MRSGTVFHQQRTIPLSRAVQVIWFVDFLHDAGAPVERTLTRARVPISALEDPNSWVSTLSQWSFVERIAHSEGIPDLPFRVIQYARLENFAPGLMSQLQNAPTLFMALKRFGQLANLETTNVRFWLSIKGDQAYFCHRGSFDGRSWVGVRGFDHMAWFRTECIMQLLQMFTGENWCPTAVAVASDRTPTDLMLGHLPNARIVTGSPTSWVSFPRRLLRKPLLPNRRTTGMSTTDVNHGKQPIDFIESLKLAVQACLPDFYPNLELAAEISGKSRRTMQRRLRDLGLKYSDVVEQARLEIARNSLKTDEKLIDIAYNLGYAEPACFTRAFKRWTGQTPTEYRRLEAG